MARASERAQGIAYPQLDRDQLDIIIGDLVLAVRERHPGPLSQRREQTLGYLTGFYTKRWGLPVALGGRGRQGNATT